MGYMAGDYASGDYYAGGLLSGLASIAKGALRVGAGFLTGGPGGAVSALVRHGAAELSHDNAAPAGPSNVPAVVHSGAIGTFLRGGGRFSAAGKAKLLAQHNAALQPKIAAPMLMSGGGGFGGRRHMRWTNPKALARAERRIHSAVKHMTKYIRWVHPTKAGHAVPRFRRSKKR
ncbi:MAG TPA: hypothetical protein VEK37_01230 [Gemmatimonadaceae bacterium]|nr:hypothetical protein [Gemmatimonadaceae bacterium]